MSLNFSAALGAILLLADAGAANAQALPAEPGKGLHMATLSSADGEGGWSIDFFSGPDRAEQRADGRHPPLHWARFRRSPDAVGGGGVWTNSDACPQISGALVAVQEVFVPRYHMGRLFDAPPEAMALTSPQISPNDGRGVQIEGRALQADRSMAWLRISAQSGPATELVDAVDALLRPCWQHQPPGA